MKFPVSPIVEEELWECKRCREEEGRVLNSRLCSDCLDDIHEIYHFSYFESVKHGLSGYMDIYSGKYYRENKCKRMEYLSFALILTILFPMVMLLGPLIAPRIERDKVIEEFPELYGNG
jgi:hypothetical protein